MVKGGRIKCPQCGDTRKKNTQKTMGVTINKEGTLYNCFHCGISGKIPLKKPYIKPVSMPVSKPKKRVNTPENNEYFYNFLKKRGISKDIAKQYGVISGKKYFNGSGELSSIGFVYGENKNEPDAIKWRGAEKKCFTQEGAAQSFYGLEQLPEDIETLVIVEGELDVLALATAGIPSVSCPNGAPMKVSVYEKDESEDTKYHYVWESKDLIEKVSKIIFAVDKDEPGEALAEELARRIGRAKCWEVKWPDGCKDANDVLVRHDAETLASLIENATPVPLVGVYSADDYDSQVDLLYEKGNGKGVSTGFVTLDDLYTIAAGQLSVVTGLPGSGKSEFVDALMVNLAQKQNWTFCVASFENPVPTHIAKLSEKITGKPFFSGPTTRMTKEESQEARTFIKDHFVFVEQRDGSAIKIDDLLERTRLAVMRLGCRGVVIDPYNYIETSKGDKEHQSISAMLTRVAAFAKAYDIHVWFVAHPAKMYPDPNGKTPAPVGMHISGSAAWFAKADCGITVHRGGDYDNNEPEIHCWKSRFKWVGRIGMTKLKYDVPTGRFSDINENWEFD
jgi:twinkle protein